MVLGTKFIRDSSFVELLFVIVLGWILVALWQRWIDNVTFNTFHLNKDSAYQTFIIAVVATTIFTIFVFSFDTVLGDIVESDFAGGFAPPAPPAPIVPTDFNFNLDELILEEEGSCHSCLHVI